jgi:hypothetical protein
MGATQQLVLFIIGCFSLVVGVCLIAWRAVQNRARAGVRLQDVSAFLRALATAVNAFAKFIPDNAARLGWLLVVVGLILIFLPFYLP